MGYLHIDNLYKNQTILLFRECYALEKIHGTSAHVSWKEGLLTFFSGGEKHERFQGLFDGGALGEGFAAVGHPRLTVYGEAYGGKGEGRRDRNARHVSGGAGDASEDVPHARGGEDVHRPGHPRRRGALAALAEGGLGGDLPSPELAVHLPTVRLRGRDGLLGHRDQRRREGRSVHVDRLHHPAPSVPMKARTKLSFLTIPIGGVLIFLLDSVPGPEGLARGVLLAALCFAVGGVASWWRR